MKTNLSDRLSQQLQFIMEIDKLKTIFRQTVISDKSREENDAEHSWHLAMMVITLAEYSNEPIDLLIVLKMVLLHDIVEIDAGDVFFYDVDVDAKAEKEQKAADRIFGMLPTDLKDEYMGLWHTFEEGKTAEAKFARAIDRIHPFLQNMVTDGHTWKKHNVKADKVRQRLSVIQPGSDILHELMLELTDRAVDEKILDV